MYRKFVWKRVSHLRVYRLQRTTTTTTSVCIVVSFECNGRMRVWSNHSGIIIIIETKCVHVDGWHGLCEIQTQIYSGENDKQHFAT